ncbi:MAG: hypothetical protein U7123_20045 [Potamolinea sp.]
MFRRLAIGTDPADSMDGHLSRQPRVFPRFLVNQGLYGYLVGQLLWSLLIDVLAAASKSTKDYIKFFNLVWRYFKFAANCEDLGHFQRVKIIRQVYYVFTDEGGVEPLREIWTKLPKGSQC